LGCSHLRNRQERTSRSWKTLSVRDRCFGKERIEREEETEVPVVVVVVVAVAVVVVAEVEIVGKNDIDKEMRLTGVDNADLVAVRYL